VPSPGAHASGKGRAERSFVARDGLLKRLEPKDFVDEAEATRLKTRVAADGAGILREGFFAEC
jgi:hypothetical protein